MKLPAHIASPDPNIYMSDNYLVLDFEVDTSHGDYGHARHPDNQLLLACWSRPSGCLRTLHRWWGNELEQHGLIEGIESADFIVAHNAKYELGWLKRMGVDLRKLVVFDTKLAEYVLLGNTQLSTSLDMCCRRRGLPIKDPVVDQMLGSGINPVRMPRPWLQGRCEQDVITTEQVFKSQRIELQRRGLLPVLFTRCLLTPVLADIEQEGMALDPEKVEAVYQEHAKGMAELQQRMDALTGGINWRSQKQVAEYLYDVLKFPVPRDSRGRPQTTSGGARPTDAETVARFKPETDAQKAFVRLRAEIGKVNAALTKALQFYVGVCREYGGQFFAELNQTVTATHRLSSSGVPLKFQMFDGEAKSAQLQNQPRAFKELFRAKRESYMLVDPDGSGLEFRVAGALSGDPQILEDIETGHDPHTFTASVLYGVEPDKVSKSGPNSQRQLAKPNTFKPLYGGSKGTASEERYYRAFRERYAKLASTQKDWIAQTLHKKRLVTPWGLVYYFPNIRKENSGFVTGQNQISNYPIQAFATAEIMPIALAYLWHRIGAQGWDEYMRIVNFVHDSAPTEVHPDYLDRFKELVLKAYTLDVYEYLRRVYGFEMTVPLGVGIKAGSHWGTGKEYSFTIWPDGRERQDK